MVLTVALHVTPSTGRQHSPDKVIAPDHLMPERCSNVDRDQADADLRECDVKKRDAAIEIHGQNAARDQSQQTKINRGVDKIGGYSLP